jgi:tetratricopeptide (TPR) repeat protein
MEKGFYPYMHLFRAPIKNLLAAATVLLLTGGCANLTAQESAEPPAREPVAEEQAPEPKYPDVELTGELLYDIMLGEVARQRGHFGIAVDALTRAAEASRDPRLIERALRVAVFAKRGKEAERISRLWIEVQPDNPVPREALGALLVSQDKTAEAQGHFQESLRLYGKNLGRAYQRISEVLSRSKNQVAALELMDSLVEMNPENRHAQFFMAQLARRLQAPERAMVAIERALSLQPDWDEAAIFKLHLLILAKDHTAAEQFGYDYLREHPKLRKLRMSFARYLLDNKQVKKAMAQFQAFVEHYPEDVDASFAVGLLAMQARQFDQARHYLKRVIELKPNHDQARLYLGQIELEQKNYRRAEKWFQEVTETKHVFEARVRLAIAIARQDELDKAIQYLHDTTADTEKRKIQLILTEEQVLREARELDRAMTVMNKALEAYPDDTELLYARGLLAAQMDNLELHERDMRKLLAKDPKNAHALNALGYTLADQTDRYQEAEKLVRKALELKPDDAFILDSMGWVEYRLGKLEAALEYLRKAIDKQYDAEIAAHLGEVLWRTGDQQGARSVWDKALKVGPDNSVLLETIRRFTGQ